MEDQNPVAALREVTQSDTADNAAGSRGMLVDGSGALKIVYQTGEEVTYTTHPFATGVLHPVRIKRVYDTGTDAGVTVYVGYDKKA